MADKPISELVAAEQITATDMFVLEQNGTAKKLTGQVLLNWLTAAADGHGGIQSIAKLSTSGLADTYRITLADTTVFDFVVTNGRGISSLQKTGTSGLVDTYTFTYNDGTTDTLTVTNGAKGDKGDNAYMWIKYASQEPTADSHSFGDMPDAWIGVYFGGLAEAPTDWQQYTWFQWKGDKGDTGDPATLTSSEITYQASDSGTIIPSGSWSSSVPTVTPGRYLWTRQVLQFNTGNPITSYSVSRFGIDGTGAVSTVNGVGPDSEGDVAIDAASVKALPIGGGTMEGSIYMNGQPLYGLNAPTANDEAATKGYVDSIKIAAPRNLLDNSDFTNPINQRSDDTYDTASAMYTFDRWKKDSATVVSKSDDGITLTGNDNGWYQILPDEVLKRISAKTCTLAIRVKAVSEGSSVGLGVGDGGGYITTDVTQEWTTIVRHYVYDYANYPSRNNFVIRVSGSIIVKWAVLYEEEYSAETLPEYQPKGYGVEMAECQRYYQVLFDGVLQTGGYVTNSAKSVEYSLKGAPMREITPTTDINIVSLTVRGSSGYLIQSGTSGFSTTLNSTRSNAKFGHFAFQTVLTTAVDENNVAAGLQITGRFSVSADL